MIIQIYNDEGVYLYDVELVKLIEGWRKQEPFIWEEKVPYHKTINAIFEHWVTKVVSDNPFDNGREEVRFVPRYYCTGLLTVNEPPPKKIIEDEDWYLRH